MICAIGLKIRKNAIIKRERAGMNFKLKLSILIQIVLLVEVLYLQFIAVK